MARIAAFARGGLLPIALVLLAVAATGVAGTAGMAGHAKQQTFPDWSFNLKLWPFDILYPDTSQGEIAERLDAAVDAGANATIVYIEEEHMYGTFVDDDGFAGVLDQLRFLIDQAHDRDLKVIVYLNGLEVMTHNAVDPATCAELPGDTMARVHPDWLQLDLDGEAIVFSCIDSDWVTPDMEDAWVSPFSPYRELFIERLASLGEAGADAVYIDATFLPGFQPGEEALRWGTTDPAANAEFLDSTGFTAPLTDDWEDPAWRSWLVWRHEAIRDYLGDLADAAWDAGMVPFWESSTNDTLEGTVLANETSITALNAMGFSPEIEPEGDWLAAFRMACFARDMAPDQPMIYLGWPIDEAAGRMEFATTLAVSGTLYPTADAPYPADAFGFADSIRSAVLDRRSPHWGHVALVYSVRNKDWTWPDGTHFAAYDDAFRDLAKAHVPFRVLVLEHLSAAALIGFDTVILPELPSISDAEHALLQGLDVIVLGEAGIRDQAWQLRPDPLQWSNQVVIDLDEIDPGLPFTIDAPDTTHIAFYSDSAGGHLLFAVHEVESGNVVLSAADPLTVTTSRRGHQAETTEGTSVTVEILGELSVLHVAPEAATPEQVSIGDDHIEASVDEQMRLSIIHLVGGEGQSLTWEHPSQSIVLGGTLVEAFILNAVSQETINNTFGSGQRTQVTAHASGPNGDTIELAMTLDLHDAYPGTVVVQNTFTNLGTSEHAIDAAWSSSLRLDRRLVSPTEEPFSFKMLTMGTIWGNGEHDRIWDLAADSSFANYNGGDVSNPEFDRHWGGGGTPISSVWSPETALTLAVVEPEIVILSVPVTTRPDGTVEMGIKETVDLGTLAPGGSYTTVRSSITAHSGDFFDGVAAYGGMMRDLGAIAKNFNPVDYEAYWCSFGLDARLDENPADRELVDNLLYIPADLDLEWINIDSGWEDMGACTVNGDTFDDEQEFIDWVADLHTEGFRVSVWVDIGFGDEGTAVEHPDWFIRNPDGSLFMDDWERHAMDPTLPAVQDHFRDCVTKLVTPQDQGGWGIDRFFVDGAFLVPPDYSGRHASPHETERAGDTLYRIMYETARSIVPDFPIECCGSGGVYNVWIQRWATTASISDPDRMELRTHEIRTKLYKALFGADAPVNGDHVEGTSTDQPFDMDYMFGLNLGLGDILQTYWWEDDWRTADANGIGDKALYQEWFDRYADLGLGAADYLNLYDLGYDEPGSHAIAVGDAIYYLFAPVYGASFSGTVELRGLEEHILYTVEDYENGESVGIFRGPVVELEVVIPANDPLLLRAVPEHGLRRPSGRVGP